MSNAATCALDALHQLAASASEVHASQARTKPPSAKLKVEMKSEEDRIRKRQLRLLKNRQSAALSRQRKKEYINDLERKAGHLGVDKTDLEYKVTKLTTMTLEYKLQVDRLEKQLQDMSKENTELRIKLSTYDPTARQQQLHDQVKERERLSSSSPLPTPSLSSSSSLTLPSLPSLSLSSSTSISVTTLSTSSPTLPPLYPPHNE